MEQTLYRKFRPGKFEELAGQEHIKRLFSKSLVEESYSHAYIFAGPRGTGKTTVARIIAKRLNCQNPSGNEPCNECSQCQAINEGSHIDVIEMDAASNRGIDDFRAVRDRVAYRPAQGKVKVYIIDEVHMLTNEAFNAILKTLEEPPDHAVFILATTNPEKIPETIMSRCQIIPFRNVTVNTIISHLQMISRKEGYTLDDDVFSYISKRAKGSMRDGIVLLEQILRFLPKDQKIQKSDILQVLGGVGDEQYEQFIKLIQYNQTQHIIEFSEKLYNDGVNFEVFLDGLTDFILNQLTKSSNSAGQKLYLRVAKEASDLIKKIKYSENPNIVFSVEFLSFAETNSIEKIPELEEKEKEETLIPTKEKPKVINTMEKAVPDANVVENKLTKSSLDNELLNELKEHEIDLYVALVYLKHENTANGVLKIFKNNNRPFSNYVIEKKEKVLRSFLNNYSLKVEISDDLADPIQKEVSNHEKGDSEFVPHEVKGIYDKLKKLFPESKIVIKDNH